MQYHRILKDIELLCLTFLHEIQNHFLPKRDNHRFLKNVFITRDILVIYPIFETIFCPDTVLAQDKSNLQLNTEGWLFMQRRRLSVFLSPPTLVTDQINYEARDRIIFPIQ